MRSKETRPVSVNHYENGQTLVLFGMLISIMVLCTMLVVDVGFFFRERQEVQKAADAAALAGAQELPDNAVAAEAVALDYVTKNGISTDDIAISFRCTSGVDTICNSSQGRYDTIVVTPTSKAPSFFGPILSVMGVSSCWTHGCSVQASAAGCRGACGPVGQGPVDVMMALDHSYSMQNSELAEAKAGVLAMFENFDSTYHRVGLAVTPPVTPSNNCDSINSWGDPATWRPAPLTGLFQLSPHVLDTNSKPVSVTNCLDRTDYPGGELQYPTGHTNIGEPIKASTDELIASGRPGVKHGIVLLTDGAANVFTAATSTASTGQRFCGAQGPQTSSAGDNNGFETNPWAVCSDDATAAVDANSGTGTSTSCTNSGKDRHMFGAFGANSGVSGTVSGIEVRIDAWAGGSGFRVMCVDMSWNNGSNWTSAKTAVLTSNQSTYILGSATDNWGRSWSTGNLADGNFLVRVTDVVGNTSTTFNLDAVAVNVYYSTPVPGSALGPCDYGAKEADKAKLAGIEIYVIAWGADDRCANDPVGSPWRNVNADVFLRYIATDDNHFYDEPKSTDLLPIFQAIGAGLAGSGSKLIE